MPAQKKATQSAHCNACGRRTNHRVLAEKIIHGSDYADGYGDINWADKYEMLQCLGSETITFKHTYWFEPTGDSDVKQYPPPLYRRLPEWHSKLPREVRGLFNEIYAALATDGRRVALMGTRALVDMIMLKHIGDVGSFDQKLTALHKAGLIGERQKDVLAAALDAGSAAAHRGHRPSREDLNAVMDIVENLLAAIYHLQPLAERLKKTTPPRKK